MLKKITLVLLLIVFAKPAYNFYIANFGEEVDYEIIAVEPVANQKDVTVGTTSQLPQVEPSQVNTSQSSSVQSEAELAEAIYNHLSNFEEQFTIEYAGNTEGLDEMLTRATQKAAKRDPYIEGHLSNREVNFKFTKTKATININQTYLISAKQDAIVTANVKELISKLQATTMNDFEKIKYVNDYIVQNTSYSSETQTSAHSAYTALMEQKAVCQGYALLAQKMLTELGVESLYVVGEAGGVSHAWNLVKVNGAWYHLDSTWNDPLPDRGQGVRYQYFLTSDTQLKKDHSWIESDYPKASSEEYTYMHNIADSYEVGDYIYYSNAAKNDRLYRLHKASGQSESVGNVRVQYLTGDGDWLYFSNYSNGGYLTKIRLNGTEQTLLIKEHANNLFVEDGFLFFTTDSGDKKVEL